MRIQRSLIFAFRCTATLSLMLLLLCGAQGLVLAQAAVLTANYDNERTNSNPHETILNSANVRPRSFGKIGSFPVDGEIFAQPLYVPQVSVAGESKNVVYVATMHNSLYAIDGDKPSVTDPLWQINFGPSVPAGIFGCGDFNSEIGILSTPVIDVSRNAIYVVSETFENGTPVFRLHALDLATGRETGGGSVTIHATVPGTGYGNVDGVLTLDPMQHIQRPGLLLLNNVVYMGFGSHCDQDFYHGWILAYSAANISQQIAVFNVTPNAGSGAIWQSGRGLAAGPDSSIYVASGNGDYDGGPDFGESFIKLDTGLNVLDWFAPSDWKSLSDVDYDLGSLGPVLVPNSDKLIGGDKYGNLYVISRQNMGHLGSDGDKYPQIFRAVTTNGIFNIALWNRDNGTIVFVEENGDWTAAFRLSNGSLATAPFSKTTVNSDYPFQGMAVSSDGSVRSSGILWMTAGNHFAAGVPGTLHAFDALDLTHELWNSNMRQGRDRLGAFAKFVAPTVANGRVYVPTWSNQLAIYGLLE